MSARISPRPTQPSPDGLSVATAIDLTDDDPPLPPRPPTPSTPAVKVEASQRALVVNPRKKRKRDEPDLELPLASAKITTIVPHRYLRAADISGERKQGSHQTTLYQFPGTVRILRSLDAVREAYEEHSPQIPHDPTRLVLWTDGSGHSGSAVVYRRVLPCGRQFGPWTCYGFNTPRQELGLASTEMEQLGLIKALDIVLDQTKTQPGRWKEYSIYTDAMAILDDLKGRSTGSLARPIVSKARAITALGPTVRLHWVPSHSKVPGNVLADRVAGLAARHVYDTEDEYIDLSTDEDEYEDYERKVVCKEEAEIGTRPAESEEDIFADLEAAINNEIPQPVMS